MPKLWLSMQEPLPQSAYRCVVNESELWIIIEAICLKDLPILPISFTVCLPTSVNDARGNKVGEKSLFVKVLDQDSELGSVSTIGFVSDVTSHLNQNFQKWPVLLLTFWIITLA